MRAAEALVEEVLEPHAAEVDRTGQIPASNFDALAERGFYGFALSEGMTPDVLIDTAATVISGCLATGFVWAQHVGALRSVALADNADLRDRYVGPMAAGNYRSGVSYAGAEARPTLFAEPIDGGYLLSGSAPFVTGWGYIDAVTASVRIRSEGGNSVATLLLPVAELEGVTAERLPLIAADASATVRLRFDRTPVDAKRLVGIRSFEEFSSGRGSVTDWVNGALSLGVLQRCVRQLEDLGVDGDGYAHEYAALRARFSSAAGDPEATYCLRADIARAAVTAASAGVVAAGSRSTLSGSVPERLMREATFALVCPTRAPIKQALLNRLQPTNS
ncbi:acyl-CoA dehydrogenase family protein [Nocardia transvalensis]|uniref:acyl-CoA dehydrogenase family protein n=1 Tax=Nocardia transvalensis TaxID=37333 RepID=UPI0018953430|nr:acyl-CoA dehydrogenase family protein [Nocardia transvalensis]MBF6332020.1 acyl-CoA dehydrogenase family protein [Nocardia transvalensis]